MACCVAGSAGVPTAVGAAPGVRAEPGGVATAAPTGVGRAGVAPGCRRVKPKATTATSAASRTSVKISPPVMRGPRRLDRARGLSSKPETLLGRTDGAFRGVPLSLRLGQDDL